MFYWFLYMCLLYMWEREFLSRGFVLQSSSTVLFRKWRRIY